MKILVTNDDGIRTNGLKLLVEYAKTIGEVVVVAPLKEQSAKSQAINVRESLAFGEFEGLDCKAFYYDSTPADCVRFAYYALKEEFDIVFSGINRGYNVGQDILYSGTVGAIFEAACLEKAGLAFSTSFNNNLETSLDEIKKAMCFINKNKLLNIHNLYNINFPVKSKGISITKQGGLCFAPGYIYAGNSAKSTGNRIDENEDETLDTYARSNDMISITPLTTTRVDFNIYNKIKDLK